MKATGERTSLNVDPLARRMTERFVMIPWPWMRKANEAGRCALTVGAILWFRYKLYEEPVIVLSNVLARQAGISRGTKDRGLLQLIKAGLVRASLANGRSPRVELLPLGSNAEPPAEGVTNSNWRLEEDTNTPCSGQPLRNQ